MGRWAQRRRSGTVKPGPLAHITAVAVDTGDDTLIRVTFDTVVLSAVTSSANFTITTDGGTFMPVFAQIAPTIVQFGAAADPIAHGDGWTLIGGAGLTFTGGAQLAGPPSSGMIT